MAKLRTSEKREKFKHQLEENVKNLDRLEHDITNFGGDMSDINNLVCGQPDVQCSALCGGGGCGTCGGEGCTRAMTMSQSALNFAHQAGTLLNVNSRNATDVLIPRLQETRNDDVNAGSDAQMAYNEADKVKNESENTRRDLETLLSRIRHFLEGSGASSPGNVEQVCTLYNVTTLNALTYVYNRIVKAAR